MDGYSSALLVAVRTATPGWVRRIVATVGAEQQIAVEADDETVMLTLEYVEAELSRLLTADLDAQNSTPLAVMRSATVFPSAQLRAAGLGPVERDDHQKRMFPADVFGLVPANWSDIDDSLVEPGIAWSASKVMAHKQRHTGETGEKT